MVLPLVSDEHDDLLDPDDVSNLQSDVDDLDDALPFVDHAHPDRPVRNRRQPTYLRDYEL